MYAPKSISVPVTETNEAHNYGEYIASNGIVWLPLINIFAVCGHHTHTDRTDWNFGILLENYKIKNYDP